MNYAEVGLLAVVVLAMLCTPVTGNTGVDVTLDAASSYVFRGTTLNSGLVLQPGVEITGLPISFGIWGNFDIDDSNGALTGWEFSEIDIFFSYDLPVGFDPVGLSVGYTEYTYPGGGAADRELSLLLTISGMDVLDMLAPSIGIYYGIDGAVSESFYAELGFGHERDLSAVREGLTASLAGAVGYAIPSEGNSGFSHADVTLGIACKKLSASFTYVAQIDGDVLGDAYDTELFGKIGLTCSF